MTSFQSKTFLELPKNQYQMDGNSDLAGAYRDEHMSSLDGHFFPILNDEQMNNWLGVGSHHLEDHPI